MQHLEFSGAVGHIYMSFTLLSSLFIVASNCLK